MSHDDPIYLFSGSPTSQERTKNRSGSGTTHSGHSSSQLLPIMFTRPELYLILNVYGQQVASGNWRDYAIDMEKDRVHFAIFRKATEYPLYRICKQPTLARKQGAFSVLGAHGQILRRGHDLEKVLRVLQPKASSHLHIVG